MSSTALTRVDEYLRNSDKPNREFRDGLVYPTAMPTKLHSLIHVL